MSTLHHIASCALIASLCAEATVATPAQTSSPDLIVIEPIGGSSFSASGLTDVNDVGMVVGRNSINDVLVPFEWTVGAGFRAPTHLPPNLAFLRVNNQGDSVCPGFPFLVRADGTLVPIPDPLGAVSNGGQDVNDALQVIGQGVSVGTSSGLFTWSPLGGSVALPIPSGSVLRRMNAQGLAVGHRLINGTGRRAFVVDVGTQAWVDLHLLLGNQGSSEAFDVNDHGVVVGFGPDGTSLSAFVWSAATGFTFLPGLAGGETMRVRPNAIDNRGRVVGTAMTGAGDFHAFLWDPLTGMLDLNTLVNGGTFTLIEALDLSETGVVIGRGFHGAAWGPDRGFILYEPPVGVSYCDSAPNSTGATGVLTARSLDLGARTMELAALRLPRHSNAYTIASLQHGFVANPGGSAGNLCLGGAIGRVVGGSVLNTGVTGSLLESVDLDSIPQPNGPVAVQAGDTWHFQVWHRDSSLGIPTSNFTNGLRVVFP